MPKRSQNSYHFIIATCATYPNGSVSLQGLRDTLLQLGFSVVMQPWQEIIQDDTAERVVEQRVALEHPKTVILPLAVWDYMQHFSAFKRFLRGLKEKCLVLNPPKILEWNLQKTYLLDLQRYSIPITPSFALMPEDTLLWKKRILESGWDNPVVKPLVGQSGNGVCRFSEWDSQRGEYAHGVMIQPFLKEVCENGEVCMVFFKDSFQYAMHRIPAPRQWRANATYNITLKLYNPCKEWIAIGEKTLEALTKIHPKDKCLYARIDVLPQKGGEIFINEVELIEPALYFDHQPNATNHFIQNLLSFLDENNL